MGQETSNALKWSLRVLSIISACIGLGFIIWSIIIQNPPKSALPVGMIILGAFALAVAILGFFNSFCGRCCLSVFLFVATLVTLGELGLVISLFANLDGAVNNLVEYDISQQKADKADKADKQDDRRRLFAPADTAEADLAQKYKNDLEIGRYVFLVAVLIEFVALIVTIVMRVRYPYQEAEGDFEEQRAARSAMAQIQMEGLKSSMKKGDGKTAATSDGNFYTASGKLYKSVTRKMTEKYGEFTADPAFQKKWWQSIPGLG